MHPCAYTTGGVRLGGSEITREIKSTIPIVSIMIVSCTVGWLM